MACRTVKSALLFINTTLVHGRNKGGSQDSSIDAFRALTPRDHYIEFIASGPLNTNDMAEACTNTPRSNAERTEGRTCKISHIEQKVQRKPVIPPSLFLDMSYHSHSFLCPIHCSTKVKLTPSPS